MTTAYLTLNAVLYLVLGIWCTVSPATTALSLGFESLTPGGRSEYLVIYGGLQIGLAVMFALLVSNPAYHRLGLLISIGFYLPLFAYRVVTVAQNWPVSPVTLATGCSELVLLALAVWLTLRTR